MEKAQMYGRKPAVAGTFYPEKRQILSKLVEDYVDTASVPDSGTDPRAIIAPHAGYVYSGSIAGHCYAAIKPCADRIRRVLLLGPAHRVPFPGVALCSWQKFETPLGCVRVDKDAGALLLHAGLAQTLDQAHLREHSLEVQLPFLQTVLDDFSIVPLLVGSADAEQIAAVLRTLDAQQNTLIVVSSDLSHYLPYEEGRRLDQRTSAAIERLDYQSIMPEQACGASPLRGLLRYAQERGFTARTLCLASSGDTFGPKEEVVGYGAYVLQ